MEFFGTAAHEQGRTVLIATHDHRSLDVFDRILEMEDGTLRSNHKKNPKEIDA
jgi:putative ABC transport system ATP-binding protein